MHTPSLSNDSGVSGNSFDELLARYQSLEDRGQAPDREVCIREHPEFEREWREYFLGVDAVRALADTKPISARGPDLGAGSCFGDYELLELLGRGGMGVVYKARQRSLGRVVALKMLRPSREQRTEDVQRFFGEAESAARLQHDHIVRIHAVGEEHGHPYFSMDLVEGESLAAVIAKNPLPPRRAAMYLQKVAAAMQYAHDRGVIHRDLKPGNVLIDKQGEPRVTDFGLAKRVDCESQLTATGTPMGTPSYMSPEQARGDWREVGPHSDLYSLGATLYDLIAGRPPFRAATWSELLLQVLHQEPLSPRDLNPAIDRDLATICLKCLEKKPHDRYRSAQELADDLGRYLAGEPIRARPISVAERTWRWCRKYPLAVAAMASLAAGICLSTAFYWQAESARREAEVSLQDARGAVDELLTTVSSDILLNQPGLQDLRRKLLERARAYYQGFQRRRGAGKATRLEDARIAHVLANIHSELGDAERAAEQYAEACTALQELHRLNPRDPAIVDAYSTALTDAGSFRYKQQDLEAADAHFVLAGDLRVQLKRELETPAGRTWLDQQEARTQQRFRTIDRLIANATKNRGDVALESWKAIPGTPYPHALLDRAKEHFTTARELLANLAVRESNDPEVRHDLARTEYTLGRLHREVLLRSKTADPWLAAESEDAIQHLDEADRQLARLLDSRERTPGTELGFDALEAEYLRASALRAEGDVLLKSSHQQQAVKKYGEAVNAFRAIVDANPMVPSFRRESAGACLGLALALATPERPGAIPSPGALAEAVDWLDEVNAEVDKLEQQYPHEPTLRSDCQDLRSKRERVLKTLVLESAATTDA